MKNVIRKMIIEEMRNVLTEGVTLDSFEKALKGHDWYYGYSDDHGVWKRGSDSNKKLHDMKTQLGKLGLKDEAKELWDKYAKQ